MEDLVDPGAADAGDHVLIPEERVQRPRHVKELGERRRVGPRLRSERGDRVLGVNRVGAQQLHPRALFGPELAQAELAAVLEPDEQPGSLVTQRGTRIEQLQATG